ncbi:FAD-binding oxidoreductase [Actinosynnema sp. NPDC020468]|uniref:NAD(P)/FAD-dependent oxidoreductase n=1 Tax=Actinosynnema sp. NPDC020468 TaxID=3154488 RepID=UPI0033CDAA86
MKTVGIVGAGVVGACVAFHLAQRGVHVHCVERARPGGLTTDVSFARLSAYQQSTYTRFELSHTGMFEHARLADRFDAAPWWHPTGGVAWSDGTGGRGASFAEEVDRLDAWGYRVVRADAARANREWEPGVVFPHSRVPVVRFPDEGWIDGPLLVAALIRAAEGSGYLTMWRGAVEDVEVRDGRVVALRLANQDRLAVDAVVNAAGPDTASVAATLGGLALTGTSTRSSLVVDLKTDGDPVRHVLRGAEAHVRSAGPGRVRVRSEQVDALLPAGPRSHAERDLVDNLVERAHRTLPALSSAVLDQARVGTATFPADGLPSVGALSALSGYYEAFANSGITLAPFIGRTLATQITTGEVHPLWSQCSPDRLRVAS